MTKKTHLIEKLSTLSGKEKEQVISFFSKYPNYENRIDWNRKGLQFSDFEKVFALAETSAKNQKRKAKENPRLLFEKYNCEIVYQTEEFLAVVPLDWECAVFFNSFDCGGEGAKWCIGKRDNPCNWYGYAQSKSIFILIYFTKKHPFFGKKIIFQYYIKGKRFSLWFQNNKKLVSKKIINLLFKNKDIPFIFKIWKRAGKHIEIIRQLFKVMREELLSNGNALWQKIHIPKYYIEDSTLVRWYDTDTVEAVIPYGVISIGESAFWYCENLEKINIPYGVTSIEESTFSMCEKLTTINLPDSITSIGDRAFSSCHNLTTINIPSGVTSIGKEAFYSCDKLERITIPDTVLTIGKEAFCSCNNLKSINIPNDVTSIEDSTFKWCRNLTTIHIPKSVKSIGKEAFYDCYLESVNIPKGTRVARNAFEMYDDLYFTINRY